MKTRELEAIDHRMEVLWAAWERSCEVEEVRTKSNKRERQPKVEGKGKDKKVVGHDMVVVETNSKVQSKKLLGDPRYMAEITKCQELRCRILGFLKDDKSQQMVGSQTNVFVLLEEAVKPRPDPIEVRLQEEQKKVEQLGESTHSAGTGAPDGV